MRDTEELIAVNHPDLEATASITLSSIYNYQYVGNLYVGNSNQQMSVLFDTSTDVI